MKKFLVKREHFGDRFYKAGEVREANEADVQHLVPGILAPVDVESEKQKAAPKPRNKAAPKPKNKAE